MDVTWHLLGPSDIRADGVPLAPPPPASRALLAKLLLSAGRVVSAEHLIDALWGEELPDDPTNALQGRVAKLRRALTACGLDPALVRTRAPGYVIDIDPESVDALRYERLVGAARAAVVSGEADEALATFDAALGLWAGSALDDLGDLAWVHVERARLDELRLAAQEDRLELLSSINPAAAVPELETLLAIHPLRERLTRLLMLALYRQGRQADALAAYDRLRTNLAEELGLDPSPDAQALSQAILRQEEGLQPATLQSSGGRSAADRHVSAPALQPLPARVTTFVGRETDVEGLLGLLEKSRLVTLTGMGGLGKTSLALEVARHLQEGVRPVHLVRLAHLEADGDVAEVVGEQLGIPIAVGMSPLDQIALALRDSRALVVIDNCEHVVDAAAFVVEELLARCPELSVLATSRQALAVSGEVQWPVAPLSVGHEVTEPTAPSAAAQLFLDRAQQAAPSMTFDAAAMEQVGALCRDLDGVPLAIELAAARVRMLPLPQLRSMISERLDVLGAGRGDEQRSTLRATLDWSYRLLSPSEQTLLERLSVFSGGWTLEAAETVCAGAGVQATAVLPVLSRLIDRSLVVPDPTTGRFRLLVIVQHYAWEQLSQRSQSDDWVRAHLAWFLEFAVRNERSLRAGTGYRIFSTEAANLRAALRRSWELGADDLDRGLQLAVTMVWYWHQGPRSEGVRALEEFLDADVGSEWNRAAALQGLGLLLVYYPTPRSQASARESLAIFERLGEEVEAAKSRLIVAQESMYGSADAAPYRRMIEQSREVLGDLDGGWWRAITYYVDAILHLRDGEFAPCVSKGEIGAQILRTTGDRASLSALLSHLGLAHRMSGDHAAAVTLLREALTAVDDAPARHTGAFALVHLGHALLDAGGHEDEAAIRLAEGDALARQVANPRCQAWAAWGRGRLAELAEDRDTALAEAQLATELFAGREFPWALRSLEDFLARLRADSGDVALT